MQGLSYSLGFPSYLKLHSEGVLHDVRRIVKQD